MFHQVPLCELRLYATRRRASYTNTPTLWVYTYAGLHALQIVPRYRIAGILMLARALRGTLESYKIELTGARDVQAVASLSEGKSSAVTETRFDLYVSDLYRTNRIRFCYRRKSKSRSI